MRTLSIHYERKRSDGAYGNRTMAVSAELDADEDPGPALDDLAALVRDRLDREERAEEQAAERARAAERERYRAEQAARQARWERDRVASARHEHDMTADLDDEDDGEDDLDDEDDRGGTVV